MIIIGDYETISSLNCFRIMIQTDAVFWLNGKGGNGSRPTRSQIMSRFKFEPAATADAMAARGHQKWLSRWVQNI